MDAFPGAKPDAYPAEAAAFSGGASGNPAAAAQRQRTIAALAKSNPNLVRAMPGLVPDQLPR